MKTWLGAMSVATGLLAGAPAFGQTFNIVKSAEAPHYDGARTTWSPASDIVNMFQDTLVALDWDGKTPVPYLAKSWTISPDGRTYTFQLRDDVSFCSGKKFTAEDVVYSFRRLKDPATKAPFAWRAGDLKEIRATGPYTVEYELANPFSELLLQLTMFTNAIHNKDSVEALGKEYGISGADGTGPWCFVTWKPRTEVQLRRHDAYRWGPSLYQNKGPARFERISIKIIPEDSSRSAAMMGGQFDFTNQFPLQFLEQAKKSPMLNVQQALPNFQLNYYGYKISRPMLADRRVREAMNIAINRSEIVKGIMFGSTVPAYTFVDKDAQDFAPATAGVIKEDIERARRLLDEAGWVVGADGIREKDGMKLAPKVYFGALAYFPKVSEAIQGYMRKIGVDWKLNALDSTIAPIRMGEQDYEIWTVTVPYMSASDLMNLYFDSANIPTPNRMNWKDPRTDQLLAAGKAALNPLDRTRAVQEVQEIVTSEHLWMPIMNVNMYMVTNKKVKNARPHMLYQNTFYKGLDISF